MTTCGAGKIGREVALPRIMSASLRAAGSLFHFSKRSNSIRTYATEPPRPFLSTSQSIPEATSTSTQSRLYYATHPHARDLPKEKVRKPLLKTDFFSENEPFTAQMARLPCGSRCGRGWLECVHDGRHKSGEAIKLCISEHSSCSEGGFTIKRNIGRCHSTPS
jgi:hypothetical protein